MAACVSPSWTSFRADQPVIEAGERGAAELGHVDLDPSRSEVVHEGAQEALQVGIQVQRGVGEVDPHDSQGFLLGQVFGVEHPHVDDDVGGFAAGVVLEADAEPSVAFLAPLVALGGHGVGEDEEARGSAPFGGQALGQEAVFVLQHLLQPRPADIPVGRAVDGVADRHVVGRHGFGDGSGGSAHAEEPPRDFLPGADFGEDAVFRGVEVDLERLLLGAQGAARTGLREADQFVLQRRRHGRSIGVVPLGGKAGRGFRRRRGGRRRGR
jgi:hypothetical protein